MQEENKHRINLWLGIAKSDLKSAQILYSKRQYRNSLYNFQQALEKANKAFILKANNISEEELFDTKHDLFKLFRKEAVKKIDGLELQIKNLSEIKTDTSKIGRLERKHKSWSGSISSIDQFRNIDISSLTINDLNFILKEFKKSIFLSVDLPNVLNKKARGIVSNFLKRLEKLENKKALVAKMNFEEIIKDEENFKLSYEFIAGLINSMFVVYAFYACAIITHKQNTLTRYPIDNHNPLSVYTLKHPLIKKQPDFMKLFEKALIKFDFSINYLLK